jgi:phosphohistidine phosphatase
MAAEGKGRVMGIDAARWLIVLRHAKSAWPDVDDHERPLAPRGERDAPRAGRWLRDAGQVPDQVVCSTARRTRETWALAQAELGASPPVSYDDEMYGAGLGEILRIVRHTPDSVRRLLLVGHEPGVSEVTLCLGRGSGPYEQVQAKFPTGAIAVLAVPGGWSELAPGRAKLTDFYTPRGGTAGD